MSPSLAIDTRGRPTPRRRGRSGGFSRLREGKRVVANLSFGGLGLLLMLVLSLMGLSVTAGRNLSPEPSLIHATPSTIPVESTHHVQLLP